MINLFDIPYQDSQGLCIHCKHYNRCPSSTKGMAACRIECPSMAYPLGGGDGWRTPPESWIFEEK